jgi:sugar phosphate isomerase/epimerase
MKIGLCVPTISSTVTAEAGFDFIEENVQTLLVGEEPDDAFAPRLKAVQTAALPVLAANCFLPGALKCTGPDVDLERIVRYADTAFRRAKLAGLRTIVFGSGGARNIPDGFDRARARDQFIACLKRIGPLAEAQGVTIVIEPLNKKECNFINSLAEGASIAEAASHPNVLLLADVYHMCVDGEAPDEIIVHGRWLHHIHVAELEGRFAPGTGGHDFDPHLRALKKINYSGPISFECVWKQFPEQAAASLKSFREQVRQAGLA